MNDRVYVLLEVMDGKTEQVVRVLQQVPGVVTVEALEGPPDVVVVIEAPERKQLAKRTIAAMGSVERLIEQVRLLPARDGQNTVINKLRLSR